MASSRIFNVKKGSDTITPCPKCGNNSSFIGHSSQVFIDSCEIWVSCQCGYDPTILRTSYRFEDVFGALNNENLLAALECWNDVLRDHPDPSSSATDKKTVKKKK